MKDDRVGFTSAGVTFYLLLGLFPLLVAFVGIYGLVSDPADVGNQIGTLQGVIPGEMLELLEAELTRVAARQDSAGIGAVVGIALAFWGGSKATGALIEAMNIVYDEEDSRGFLSKKLVALGLAVGATIFLTVVLGLLAIIPAMVAALPLPEGLGNTLTLVRWPVLFVVAMLWLCIFYRYAPNRSHPKWRWVSWGAFLATLLWVVGSVCFSLYVKNFANYSGSYGALAAVIVLLMWCFITAFCVLLGAEINAEMEHQTTADSTTGEPQPVGERGAHVADHVPGSPPS